MTGINPGDAGAGGGSSGRAARGVPDPDPGHRVEFVSAGPGDPGLLTLAGAEALQRCSAVLAPGTFQESFAPLLIGKEVGSPFQMPHAEVVAWVEERLPRGSVAFLIPGDFSSFCPFQSYVAHFGPRGRVLPGVGAHAAAAALLKRGFDIAGVAHATVLTSPRASTASGARVRLRDYARPGHTLILYMNDLPLPELTAELRAGFGTDVPIALLERLSLPDERVTVGTLASLPSLVGERDPFALAPKHREPALALVIAGDALAATEDPSCWDRRHERLWKPRGVR
ncbi:MAG: SAM-dependent methyltransferase [Deferrisomatales bacterium]